MELVILVMVVLATAVFVFSPLFRSGEISLPDSAAYRRVADAISRRDATYQALADLDEDRTAGKLSDEDYAALKQAYTSDAINALRDLDGLGERPRTTGRS